MSNSLELGKKVIKDKIPLIPKNPGVYKMLSATGEILYIGKAKNIPNRLKSYVTESYLPIRTEGCYLRHIILKLRQLTMKVKLYF